MLALAIIIKILKWVAIAACVVAQVHLWKKVIIPAIAKKQSNNNNDNNNN